MGFEVSRRDVIEAAGAGTLVGLAGCENPESGGVDNSVGGTVTDLSGDPVSGARIEAVSTPGETSEETRSDDAGQFELPVERSAWLRTRHPEYLTRVRAVAPGTEPTVRLTPDTGTTVALGFGGDVMFGRRFYETGGDGLSERARIDPQSRAQSHREILRHVQPLLEHADITSVNLETPLTTTDWTYPDKTFQFTSHPTAAGALADAGVDYAALGNNHVFDALTPGLEETRTTLDNAGIAHSGAGLSSDSAWQPAAFDARNLTVEYVSCTTVVGEQYDIDWSADRTPAASHTVTQSGRTLTVPRNAGVAEATTEKLSSEVTRAADRADVVVVQVHGGREYQRRPTAEIRQVTDAAVAAGADLVVNHHPHVTGGLEMRDGSLIAWSLGNLVFDQVLWETLRSYVLVAHVDREGVQRIMLEPVLLDGYVPKGATGTVRKKLAADTAALSTEQLGVGLAGGGSTPVSGVQATVDEQRLTGPDAIFERTTPGRLRVVDSSGAVEFGRDRLYTGSFEDVLVDDGRYTGPLWRFRRRSGATGGDIGRSGGGLRLTSFPDNESRSVLSPASRIPVEGESYTLTGWYRSDSPSDVELLVPWYDAASGPSFERERLRLSATSGEWRQVHRRLAPPEAASFVNLFALLSPPEGRNTRSVTFDDVRLLEWVSSSADVEQYHDYVYIEDTATIRSRFAGRRDGPEWTET